MKSTKLQTIELPTPKFPNNTLSSNGCLIAAFVFFCSGMTALALTIKVLIK